MKKKERTLHTYLKNEFPQYADKGINIFSHTLLETPNMTDLAAQYQRKTEREHVMDNPDT